MSRLKVVMSPGEVLDRLTILEIKAERLSGQAQEVSQSELDELSRTWKSYLEFATQLWPAGERVSGLLKIARLRDELLAVNERLWQLEDDIRRAIREGDTEGVLFIGTACLIPQENDLRARLKREVNTALSADIYEVKSYGGEHEEINEAGGHGPPEHGGLDPVPG